MKILKNYKVFFAISILLILSGFTSFVIQGFNLGVDFTGGTMLILPFPEQTESSLIRESLAPFELDPVIQQSSGDS